MRIQSFLIVGCLLVGLLLASGGASICASTRSMDMPCCKSSRPCAPTGVRTGDCCRFVPPIAPNSIPAVPGPDASRDTRDAPALESPVVALTSGFPARLPGAGALHSESPPGESPPLFLLHASLLI